MSLMTSQPTSDLVERFELLLVRNFFDARTCDKIIAEARTAWGGPATIYTEGSANPVNESLRKTTRLMLSDETTALVKRRLLEHKAAVEQHFGISLNDCEDPQFLKYQIGDFFVAHQDGNTEQLQYDHLRVRRVSVVVFLSQQAAQPAPDTYCGGSLAFFDPHVDPRRKEMGVHLYGERGMFAAFPSETTHEVTPLTHGERYTIICWYR
jgi:SM-20-related protein